MALCMYCGKVEVAWHQEDRRWIACEAKKDAAGNVVKVDVRSGHKTIRRPVPDPTRRHYPHAAFGVRAESECESWTPAAAAGRPKRRAFVPRAPLAVLEAMKAITETAMPAVAEAAPLIGVPLTGVTTPAAPATPKGTSAVLPEPEKLLPAAALRAWQRAFAAIRCEARDPKGALIVTRLLLWGPPGTGKTELPWRVSQEHGWTHVYQLMTEETPASELLGHLIVQAGSTVWCDGSLGRAIRASQSGPTVLVIDEIGRASQDAMSACLLALTNPESLRLTLRSGEVIAPNPANWHVVCTSNSEPTLLDPALQDRLHVNVRLTSPNPELVRSMITPEARRAACAASREYSVRALLTYDRLRASGMNGKEACEMVWEPDTAKAFLDALKLEGRA